MILTPADQTLTREVGVGRGELPGVGADTATKFGNAGISSLDMLAAGWTGLVSDVMGVGASTAASVLASARSRVDSLQGSLRVFSGVDANLEETLRAAGIESAVALANADSSALVAALGAGVLSLELARVIVDEARRSVPASLWSLESPQAGLLTPAIDALRDAGITTLGALKNQGATPEGRGVVAAALGVSTAAVETLVSGIDIPSATLLANQRLDETPVSRIVGVDRDTSLNLARVGLSRVDALAAADAHNVAVTLGIDTARATALINAARTHLGAR